MKAGKLISLLAVVAAACGIVHADEATQAQIVRPQPDSNGVDLVTGGLYVPEASFDAPAAGKMQIKFGRSDRGNEISRLRISLSSFVVDPDPENPSQNWPRLFTATVNGLSSRFMCNEWGFCDEYAPMKGATLEFVGGTDPTLVTYTAGDGTRVKFPVINYALDNVDASEVLYPSGEKLSIQTTYTTPFSTVVTSNLGYTASIVTSGGTQTRRMYKGGTGGTLLNTISTAVEDLGPQGSTYTRRLTDDLGRVTRIHYERVVSPLCWFGDNNSMTLKWFEDASGLRTTVNYHRVGVPNASPWGFYGNMVVSTILRNGKTWSYSDELYSGSNYQKLITDPTGAVREVRSNASGFYGPPSSPDACSSGPNAFFGNILSDKTPLGRTTSYAFYDVMSNYTASDYLSSATFPEGNKFAYVYDNRGNVTKTTQIPKSGGAGKTIYEASYPATCSNLKTCNQPTWTRDAAGSQTDFTYDTMHGGMLTKLEPVDANGKRRKTWNEYEAYNTGNGVVYRLSAAHFCSILAGGTNVDCQSIAERVTRFTYWGSTFLPLTETRTNGINSLSATTTYSYDNWGRALSIVDPTGVTNYFRYDVMGRKTWEISSNGAGSWVAKNYTYDVADKITRIDRGTLPDPASTALTVKGSTINTYDVEENLIKAAFVDSAIGKLSTEQTSYDSVSRPICSVKRMNPASFDGTADACAIGPAGSYGSDRITKNFYDLDGRLTKIVQGYGAMNGGQGIVAIEMGYTNNSQLAWRKDGKSNQTSYSYDSYDRLDLATFADSSFERSEYDSANRLWKFTKRDGQWMTHSYDGASRLTSTSFSNGESTITRDYDGQGRPSTISRGGQTIGYSYTDPLGNLSSESQPYGTASFLYDLAGRKSRVTWPGGYWVDYDFNTAGALWRVREQGATSGLGLIASWTFDGLGRRASITRGNGVVTNIVRDAADRLVGLDHDLPGSSQDIQFAFARNPASQITGRNLNSLSWAWSPPSSASTSYSPDVLNRYSAVGGASLTYDGRGNLTNDGSRTYAYDFANHLLATTGGGAPAAALAYDPAERLQSVTANGIATRFLYDGAKMIADFDGSGTLLHRYIPGIGTGTPMLALEGASTSANSGSAPSTARWLLADERGSVIGLSNAVGVASINTYGPYGEPTGPIDGRFAYTGQLWLPEVGSYHFPVRDYNPRLGRFLQTDPIGYGDGMNLYSYVRNDPVNFFDPTGTQTSPDFQKPPEEPQKPTTRAPDPTPQRDPSDTTPQPVVQPKDSPYEKNGVTLKREKPNLTGELKKQKEITEAIVDREEVLNNAATERSKGNDTGVKKLEHQAEKDARTIHDLEGTPDNPPLIIHADGSTSDGGQVVDVKEGDIAVPK